MTTAVIRAQVSGDGRLLSADGPLLALQREAGADLGDPFAVPQLAAIARLSHRLGVMVSRPVTAAADHADIAMWVRAKPDDGGVRLSIVDWREHPLTFDSGHGDRQADIATLAEGWTWQVDTQLRFQMALAGQGDAGALPESPPAVGMRFSSYFQLQPDEVGDMAMLRGFAQRQAFRDQRAILSADPGRSYTLSASPLFDVGGALTGFRGIATPLRPDPPVEPDLPLTLYPADFGRRLDRSLRQPLGRIIANADTISAQLEGPLRGDYAGYASDIASAGRHLLALVDDLADLQAVDRPDFTVISEDVDLADVARRAAGLLAVKALDRSITILPPPPEDSLIAIGEFRRVLQILVNLTGNAVRYAPEGTQVRISTEWENGMARVTVADQGSGVDPADRERIFDKFERLGRDDHGGSGLGLYISRRLARAMGGDIVVGGAPGQGARFILTLPVAAP